MKGSNPYFFKARYDLSMNTTAGLNLDAARSPLKSLQALRINTWLKTAQDGATPKSIEFASLPPGPCIHKGGEK